MKVIAKPIDMIAWFTKEGVPNPVKFRMIKDDDTFEVIKINRIMERDMERLAGNNMIVFKCQSIIGGQERIYEIKYELHSCKWILFKI